MSIVTETAALTLYDDSPKLYQDTGAIYTVRGGRSALATQDDGATGVDFKFDQLGSVAGTRNFDFWQPGGLFSPLPSIAFDAYVSKIVVSVRVMFTNGVQSVLDWGAGGAGATFAGASHREPSPSFVGDGQFHTYTTTIDVPPTRDNGFILADRLATLAHLFRIGAYGISFHLESNPARGTIDAAWIDVTYDNTGAPPPPASSFGRPPLRLRQHATSPRLRLRQDGAL